MAQAFTQTQSPFKTKQAARLRCFCPFPSYLYGQGAATKKLSPAASFRKNYAQGIIEWPTEDGRGAASSFYTETSPDTKPLLTMLALRCSSSFRAD